MPFGDGTGPGGMGPMTGGRRGFCGPYPTRFAWRPIRARRWTGYGYSPLARPTRQQELDFLKDEAQSLRETLKELETEIGKLSAEKE